MKKLKEKIYYGLVSFLVIVTVILSISVYKKTNNYTLKGLIIGNEIENFTYQNTLENCNFTFLNKALTTAYILKMFEQNASKIYDNHLISLSSLIKECNYVILQFSNYDFEQYVTYNLYDNTLHYDKDILNRQIQLSLTHIQNIVQYILSIKKESIIIHIGYFYPFLIYDNGLNNILKEANRQYKHLVNDNYYLEIYNQENKNDFILNKIQIIINN